MRNRLVKVTCIVTVVLLLTSVVASAAGYSLLLKYPQSGSINSTGLLAKVAGTSPYVKSDKNTIKTNYLLSPARFSSTNATNIVTLTAPSSASFTYKSGYGGKDTSYCLSAYPYVNGLYDQYTVTGTWSN